MYCFFQVKNLGLVMTVKKNVGIYGGTFDPLHFGHINLALGIMEAQSLDEVWFCPAKINPHKVEHRNPVSTKHRMAMLKLALQDIPHIKILDIEVKRNGPSYMIDTLRELIEKKEEYPCNFKLILGDDAIPGFFKWREPKEIVRLVPLLVGRRFPDIKPIELEGDPEICGAIQKGFTPTHIFDISSTEIRERIHNKLYIGHLVPSKVVDYIYTNHLYST